MHGYRTSGTANAVGAHVSNCVALLAESDRGLRNLMGRTLAESGYVLSESSNELQLEASLRVQPFLGARIALLVLSSSLATRCARSIATAARERIRCGLRPARLILTCEFGTLAALHPPELGACVSVGVLEKPFDLHELRGLALEGLYASTTASVHGG